MSSKTTANSSAANAKKHEARRSSLISSRPKGSREHSKKSHKEKHVKNENHEKVKRNFKSHRNVFKDGGNEVDPLNIKKIISHDLPISPKCNSPLIERSERSNLGDVQPVDVTDPLKLNSLDDSELIIKTPKKKKKRKRRHTLQGQDCLDVKTVSLDELEDDVVADEPDDTTTNEQHKGKGERPTRIKRKRFHSGSKSEDDVLHPTSKVHISCVPLQKDETPAAMVQVAPPSVSEPTVTVAATESSKEVATTCKSHNYRTKDRRFIYGNYNRYYGYRNPNCSDDDRTGCLKREWFEGKKCLDIGCNVGHLTLWIARHCMPCKMRGIDIDADLIKAANGNVRHYLSKPSAVAESQFPISLAICHGPLAAHVVEESSTTELKSKFPYNVSFQTENYAPLDDRSLSETQSDVYDVILCLSVTKWIQLNWGDDAIKRMFKKMYKQLRGGGRLILEPQPFKSYKKKKNLTPEIRRNFDTMKFKPEHFIKYLLSDEIGFSSSEVLTIPQHKAKGFQRPLYLLTKPDAPKNNAC